MDRTDRENPPTDRHKCTEQSHNDGQVRTVAAAEIGSPSKRDVDEGCSKSDRDKSVHGQDQWGEGQAARARYGYPSFGRN